MLWPVKSRIWLRRSARILAVLALALMTASASEPYLHSPAVDEYARHDPNGLTILSSGRYLKPAGKHLPVAPSPYGLAMSQDGKTLFIASEGVGQLITQWAQEKPVVRTLTVPVYKRNGRERTSTGGGADFSPDGRTLYWSSGETGAIYIFGVASSTMSGEVSLNTEVGGQMYEDSYASDVKVSPDGKYLYCADVTNFRITIVDAAQRQVVGSVRVGRY